MRTTWKLFSNKTKPLTFLLSLTLCLFVFLSGCARHEILGTTYGWDASGVNVLGDVQISGLRVRHVRMSNSGCVSGYKDHLELHGPIGPDSTAVLERMLLKLDKCFDKDGTWIVNTVFLSSGGGILADGYNMGNLFRKYQVHTIVTGGQTCASSCAVAFLGGKFRTMAYDAKLIFHSPYYTTGIGINCMDKRNVSDLHTYFASVLDPSDAKFLLDRTLSYCSVRSGWTLNRDAAKLFNVVNTP